MTASVSLRQRLIRLILITSGLALVLVVAGMFAYELTSFRPNTEKHLHEEAAVLGEVLKAPLELGDPTTAQVYLNSAGAEKQLGLAVVYDQNTNFLAQFRRDGKADETPPPPQPFGIQFEAHTVAFWQKIESRGGPIGYLYLQETIPPIYARSAAYEILVAVVVLVLIVVSGSLFTGLQRFFLAPLAVLVNTTTKVARDGDYSLRADIQSRDELGHLASAFNQMLEMIGHRDAALLSANEQIKLVFDSATEIAIIATDAKGLVTLFNVGAERMLGYAAAEIIGQQTPELWHERAEIEERGRELSAASGHEVKDFEVFVESARHSQHEAREWTYVRKDGMRLSVQLVVTTIRNRANEIAGFLGMASDIGPRKRAEAALRELQRQQERILTSVGEGLHGIDQEGNIMFENPAACAMLGWGVQELIGQPAHRVMHHTRADNSPYPQSECQIYSTLRDGVVRRVEDDLFWRKDGTAFPVTYTATPMRNETGAIVGVVVAFRDITERKRAESALRESEAKFRTLFDTANDAIFMSDAIGFLSCNPQALKMFGCRMEEIIGRSPAEFSPVTQPDGRLSRGLAHEKTERALAGQPQFFEWRHARLDQTTFEAEVSLNRIEISGKIYLQGIVRDITNRKRAEIELQRREEYFRSLIEHASDCITVVNAQAMVTYQSPSGERILGYPAEAMLGRILLDLAHPEDLAKLRAALNQSLEHLNLPVTLTVRLRHHNGLWRHIEAVGTSIQNAPGEKQIIINSRDVSDNLKLEEQFRQAQKMEAVGQLAGGVAHDFNNILSALLMQTELVKSVEALPQEAKEGLDEILTDINRAADLTRQLLFFGRRQVMQSRVLNLNELITNLSKMLQRLIREDVQLQLQLHGSPLMTRADPGMLEQVLMNLAVNARDAMPKGGRLRVETTELTLTEEAGRLYPEAHPGHYVSFSVSDSGGGIPPEVLPQIFEPFFTTKEAGKGTGLGLATVFGIVKQHQGWIKMDNRPGEGVAFHIFLPASREIRTDSAPAKITSKPNGGAETILLVEDESMVRKPTRKLLERQGYQVLEAADGIEALRLWQDHGKPVALLLTDLVMPGGLTGQELARRLVAEQPQLKVIYVSGYSADIAGRDFQLRPGESFIQKPYATDELLETIRRFLDA